jgi:hypothetical protein
MGENGGKRNWTIPAVALVVIVILSVIALTREPVELDPDTPQGVVQTYLQAIADEEYTGAHALLSTEIQGDCAATDIAANVYYESFNAVLGDVTEVGDTAIVEASVQFGSAPLDPGIDAYYEQFFLVQQGGKWVISGDPWPYFTYGCRP